jgi:hypothetical protein
VAYEDISQFVVLAARGASGNSGAIPLGKSLNVAILIEVTAQSGTTPTLDFSVEWSMDGVTFGVAQPVDTFIQITTVVPTRVAKSFANKGAFFRLVWTLAGTTPNYTFSASRYGVGT